MFMQRTLRILGCLVAAVALAATANSQNVRILGRSKIEPDGGFSIQWPASGFEATFEGTTLEASIYDWGSNWLNVEIDGVISKLALGEGSQTYTLFKGARGTHTLRVTRRTGTDVGVTTFEKVKSDGRLQPTTTPERRILVIGDSFASGHGVEGANQSCSYSYDTQNADLAFPAILARSFDADLHVVAADGRGLIRNYAGDQPAMNAIAWQTLAEGETAWAALAYQPQVIVVNLGTSDFTESDPGASFEDAYVLMLRRLRQAYPEALILGSIGGSLWGKRYVAAKTAISDAVGLINRDGDKTVRFVEFKLTAGPGRYGCDFHPGKRAQTEMATDLAYEIEKSIGWKSPLKSLD
jgi:hypothetical protein